MTDETYVSEEELRELFENLDEGSISVDDMRKVLLGIAKVCQHEGIGALAKGIGTLDYNSPSILISGLSMILNGVNPSDVKDILETKCETWLQNQKIKTEMIKYAITAIASSKKLDVHDTRLKSMYGG